MNRVLVTSCFIDKSIPNFFDYITIFAILLTVTFFVLDKYLREADKLKEYLNKLISLKFELSKNYKIISELINRGRDELLENGKIVYFRYDILVIEKVISDANILNSSILRQLDGILFGQKQINMMLDHINEMANMSHINSTELGALFRGRISATAELIIQSSDNLARYYKPVINALEEYINKTKSKKFFGLVKFDLEMSDKEIRDEFWKDIELGINKK